MNFKIQERAKKSEEGQNLRLYDNEKEFNDLERAHQEVRFNQPMTQSLADRLFKEIENAYTKDSYEKVNEVEPEEKMDQPKIEESKTIEQEKEVSQTEHHEEIKKFLNENPDSKTENSPEPIAPITHESENVTDLSIQEMATQIYNQRKIMQAIASECTTLEEYFARVGGEVTVMPSNDEIEAEMVKIKK